MTEAWLLTRTDDEGGRVRSRVHYLVLLWSRVRSPSLPSLRPQHRERKIDMVSSFGAAELCEADLEHREEVQGIHIRRMCGLRQVSFSSTFQPRPVMNDSSSGGWWTRPHNWLSNTAIAFTGIIAVTAMVWSISAKNEVRIRFTHHLRG